jgi:glycosyltransferase involved in cell wall biosynthesis
MSRFDGAVVISPFFWNFEDDLPGTTLHIAAQLARRLPTLLVEPSAQWNPRSEQFRVRRLLRALGGGTRSPRPGLTVFHRRSLPFGRFEAIRERHQARDAERLARTVRELGFRRPLLWHSFPYWTERLEAALPAGTLAYHCLDFCARPEEEALVRRADRVFCVSETLVAKHRALNPRTHLLANGVDLELFDPARAERLPPPSDLAPGRRHIGFLGAINHHLDLDLLLAVARAFPEDSLTLVGKVQTRETAVRGGQREALDALRRLPNVAVLGFKPTADVPRYLHAFDVCLIPFRDDPFNRECDPLKLYEYAAMGKPVVSTRVAPASVRYESLGYVADTPSAFVQAVARALSEPEGPERRRARQAMARAHGWEAVVSRAWEVLDPALEAAEA